jgi:hypothetical protein
MSWPNEDRQREVYLRPTGNAGWLAEDVSLLPRSDALLLSLSTEGALSDTDDGAVDAAARGAHALVTNVNAFSQLAEGPSDKIGFRLFEQALLRAGRGLIADEHAAQAATAIAEGIEGAAKGRSAPTEQATSVLNDLLEPEQAARVTRVLQAVWEGSGAGAATFPGQGEITGHLNDGDLSYLLTSIATTDAAFWRRIGRTITLEQICRLSVSSAAPNFQSLVSSLTDQLFARTMRVHRDQATLDSDSAAFRWALEQGCLALMGETWTAYLTADTTSSLPAQPRRSEPTVSELRRMAQAASLNIIELEAGRGSLAITVKDRDAVDLYRDLGSDEASGHASEIVAKATATISGGRRLGFEFATRTASVPKASPVSIQELLAAGVPLLAGLDPRSTTALRAHLGATTSGAPAQEDNQEVLELE